MWKASNSTLPETFWKPPARLEGLLQIDPEKRFNPELALSQTFLHKEHPNVSISPFETEEVVNNSWLL